jgi:hypothetical protein
MPKRILICSEFLPAELRAKVFATDTITTFTLPPYAPETNPIKRVWEHLKERYLSQRLRNDYDAIVDATCIAWNELRSDAGRITSLTWTPWNTVSQKYWRPYNKTSPAVGNSLDKKLSKSPGSGSPENGIPRLAKSSAICGATRTVEKC